MDSNQIPTIGYSIDGRSWNNTNKLISKTCYFNSVAYNGNMWIVVGNSQAGIKIATSTDGINWSLINNYISGSLL
jgi:N-acetylneuraminic acid mutarotase